MQIFDWSLEGVQTGFLGWEGNYGRVKQLEEDFWASGVVYSSVQLE